MGTAKGGQDNSIFEMHSRGLTIIARKMSGAEESGAAEGSTIRPDALCHNQDLGWCSGFSCSLAGVALGGRQEG